MAYRRTAEVQARLDAQRAAVLAAAIGLLGERGYGACSIAAVAARAGIASGTVYNHFGSKSELIAEVFRTVVSREVEQVQAAASGPDGVTGRVVAVVETFAGRALKAPRLAYALLAEPVDPAVDALRLEFRTAFRDVLADLITAAVAGGELPPQEPAVVAAALVGAIAEAMVGPLSTGEDATTVPTLATFALRALGGPDGRHP
jgi:AcrR family transcriptional regulator